MTNVMKTFYTAGLLVEDARERRDEARARLREAALVHCPEELAALDRASEAVEAAEKNAAEVITALLQGKTYDKATVQDAAKAHRKSCNSPSCETCKALAQATGDKGSN